VTFGREFFSRYKYKLGYDDFYTAENNPINIESVIMRTGVPFSAFMWQTIRSFCCTARLKFTKKENIVKKTVDSNHFFSSRSKSNGRLHKIIDNFLELKPPTTLGNSARIWT
jgi:hypothetical protein